MYADCFLIPIKKSKVAAYKKMATLGYKAWKKHGALDYKETVGDDLNHGAGIGSFAKLLKLKKGETCVVAWITYKSKAHRNAVNKKVMAQFTEKPKNMPFDETKMRFGGFKVLVGA